VVVLTHADNDHVGGLPAVLEQFPVGMVLDSGAKHRSATYLRFLDLARRPTIDYRQVRAGGRLSIDDRVQVNILGPSSQLVTPEGEAPLGLNNASEVIRLGYGEIGFLLSGDIEEPAEEVLLRSAQPLNSAVLKVPHHGSLFSSSEPFVMAIQPAIGVISLGAENKFGHPHPRVLERYSGNQVKLFRTDRDGAVVISTDGRNLKAVSMLGDCPGQILAIQDDAGCAPNNFWDR
jgi:competence protein ComEC